jgi:hypothetical protein
VIRAVITHIGQNLDLKRRSFDHTIKLQLPDGSIIGATIDERSVEQLMKFVAEGDAPTEERAPDHTDEFASAMYDGQPANVFGGDASGELEPDDSQMSLPIQPAPAPPPRPVPMPQPARVRTVPKDEYGFPIVQASGMDAGSVLAEAIDDDGVPQI